MATVKCVAVGDPAVGKSSLLFSYKSLPNTDLTLRALYEPSTLYAGSTHCFTLDNERVALVLWDARGDNNRFINYSKTDVFLVCFSLVSPASYENVRAKWYPEVSRHCPNTPIILVGTKLDLRDDPETMNRLKIRHLAPISHLEGMTLAKEMNAVNYLECSAVSRVGLSDVLGAIKLNAKVEPEGTAAVQESKKRSKGGIRSVLPFWRWASASKTKTGTEPIHLKKVFFNELETRGSTLSARPTEAQTACWQDQNDDCVYDVITDEEVHRPTGQGPEDNEYANAEEYYYSSGESFETYSQSASYDPAAGSNELPTNSGSTPHTPSSVTQGQPNPKSASAQTAQHESGKKVKKLVLVGDEAVGNTCLILSQTKRRQCPTDYIPTETDDFIETEFTVDGQRLRAGLWDLSGAKDFDRVRPDNYYHTQAIIVCFSLASPSTFDSVRTRWYPEVTQHCPGIPIVLVGTKADLRKDSAAMARLRQKRLTPIVWHQGEALAREIGAKVYLECSAVSQVGVDNVFEEALRLAGMCCEGNDYYYVKPVATHPLMPPVIPPHPNEFYPVTSPQGICLVINVYEYEDCSMFETRLGAHIDVDRVRRLFTAIGFQVTEHNNLKCHKIAQLFNELASSKELEQHGSFVCFLMAHGASGRIFGSDGESLEIRSIVERFRANQCASLRHKPKIFFIQACRGLDTDFEKGFSRADRLGFANCRQYAPLDSDFLLCYATTEEYAALRDEQSGSPFVQTLCSAIEEQHKREHLVDIMTRVNGHLKENPVRQGPYSMYAVSEFVSRLSKKCFLDPDLADL